MRLDPAYSKTPSALVAIAELYEGMGRVFSADRYYLKSVKTYQFLLSGYPYNQIARDALFTLAEIYSTDLENPQEARRTFQQFLEEISQVPQGGGSASRPGALASRQRVALEFTL